MESLAALVNDEWILAVQLYYFIRACRNIFKPSSVSLDIFLHVCRHADTQVYRYTGIQIYGYRGTQVYRYMDTEVHRYTGTQVGVSITHSQKNSIENSNI